MINRIKELKCQRSLTYAQISQLIGCHPSQLSRWLRYDKTNGEYGCRISKLWAKEIESRLDLLRKVY